MKETAFPDCEPFPVPYPSASNQTLPGRVGTRFPRWWHAVIAITLFMLLWSAGLKDALPTAISAQPERAATTPYLGAGSCSAVACHGSILPLAGSPVLRNEHTTWISDDKHSRAFQVLFDARSKQIALNLAGDKDLVPAHEEPRCLACHTTPRTASERRDTAWMNQDGVGCESCHGSAKDWLGPHTTDGWKSREFSSAVKESYRFTDTKNVVRRLEVCVGCHVGQDGQHGLTPRDVNHDLIAAGHPRLNFEFAAYQANQPPHWDINKPGAAEAAADFPARAWAVGQLVSGKAALQLLAARAAHVDEQPGLPSALPNPGHASHPGRNSPNTAAFRATTVWPMSPGAEIVLPLVCRRVCRPGARGTSPWPPPSSQIPVSETAPRSGNS